MFGIEKKDAEKVPFVNGKTTIDKLYKTYWQKRHHRTVAKGDEGSIFFKEHNYTLIQMGRIFVDDATGRFEVYVGHWLEEVDQERLREAIEDEFNLPVDFALVVDRHWDIGHGWSQELV